MAVEPIIPQESPQEKTNGWYAREGIRRLRLKNGMSQAELGRRCGIGDSKLRDRMKGVTRLSVEECDAVGAVFGCDMLDLIELGKGNDPKGLLLWAKLRLVASNDFVPRSRSPRSPLLSSVE